MQQLIVFLLSLRANRYPPDGEYVKNRAHFVFNLDETCILAREGALKVIGAADRKKHEKNMDDNRASITIVRVGTAAGNSGPQTFLATGKVM